MKKLFILGFCALAAISASAQESVVKAAERAAKQNAPLAEVMQTIAPAFESPETANSAYTYIVPGKYAFGIVDQLIAKKAITGAMSPEETDYQNAALMLGFDLYFHALPLDTIVEVDKHGKEKVRTKYSKDIVNTLAGHHINLNDAAINAYNNQDYETAHRAWEYYTTMPLNPIFDKKLTLQPDSIMAQIVYYQGLASYMLEDYATSARELLRSIEMGNDDAEVYNYAIVSANQGEDYDLMLALCAKANDKYGAEDPSYIAQIINYYITNQDFNKALDNINNAISSYPTIGQYHFIKGVILESGEGLGDPIEEYLKAVELDPDNATALAYAGRLLVDQASNIHSETPESEYSQVYTQKIKPMLLQAVDYLERAYKLDPDDLSPMHSAWTAYYILQDANNVERVERIIGAE